MFVKDTFTDVAGTALNSHTGEVGATWTKHPSTPSGSVLIDDANGIRGNFAGDSLYYASGTPPASADYLVQAQVRYIDSTASFGHIWGRLSTTLKTGYLVRWQGGSIDLLKCIAGTYTTLGSFAYTPTSSNRAYGFTMGLEMFGTSIRAMLNGAPVVSVTDSSVTATGTLGVMFSTAVTNGIGQHFDYVQGLQALYWVGGNGTTATAARYARRSGGTGGVSPSVTDDLIIDQNSGNPTVTVGATISFASIQMGTPNVFDNTTTRVCTVDGTGAVAILQSSGDITVFGDAAWGSLLFQVNASGTSGKPTWTQHSNSYMPRLSIPGTIYIGHTPFGKVTCNVSVVAFGGTGILNLAVVVASSVVDRYASLNVATMDLSAIGSGPSIVCSDGTTSTELHVTTKLDLGIVSMTNANRLNIHLDGGAVSAALGTRTYGSVHINSGIATLSGDFTAYSMIFEKGASAYITGTTTLKYLALSDGNQIVITAGKTITAAITSQNYRAGTTGTIIRSSVPGTVATWNLLGTKIVRARWYVQDINFTNGVVVLYGSTDGTGNRGATFRNNFAVSYRYDVYSYTGTYLGQYTDVITEPNFEMRMNSPAGQIVVRRAVDSQNFGEGGIVDYDNKIVVTKISSDYPNGVVIYRGYTSTYKPNDSANGDYVDITFLPFATDLSKIPITTRGTVDVNIFQTGAQLAFASSKIAFSFKTGSGVTALNSLWFQGTDPVSGGDVVYSIKYRNTSSITIKLYKDNGTNTPDNTAAVFTQTYPVTNSPTAASLYGPSLTLAVTALSKYWVVIDANGGDLSQSLIYTTNTYADGNGAYWNGSSWVQSSVYGIAAFSTQTTSNNVNVLISGDWFTELLNMIATYNNLGGSVTADETTVEDPGVNFVYGFVSATTLMGIQKFIDQAPEGWFWYIDPATNKLHVHPKATTPAHIFTVANDVEETSLERTKENIVNSLFITGGDQGGGVNLFRNYVNIASIGRYGRSTDFYNDVNLTDNDAADAIGKKIIDQKKLPTVRAPITVFGALDIGYNIDLIRPGQMFAVVNTKNVVGYLQVASYNYDSTRIIIDASTIPPQINDAVRDAQQSLRSQQSVDNPSTAVVVDVP